MPYYNNGYRDDQLVHVRKTVAFDGTAGNGAVGTVPLFNVTGRVLVGLEYIFCTEDLTSSGSATLEVDISGSTDLLAFGIAYSALDNGLYWLHGGTASAIAKSDNIWLKNGGGSLASPLPVGGNIVLTIGTADVTGGTLVFDIWYRPLTADGALVAA